MSKLEQRRLIYKKSKCSQYQMTMSGKKLLEKPRFELTVKPPPVVSSLYTVYSSETVSLCWRLRRRTRLTALTGNFLFHLSSSDFFAADSCYCHVICPWSVFAAPWDFPFFSRAAKIVEQDWCHCAHRGTWATYYRCTVKHTGRCK